jgi:hypothetical protein
MADVGLFFHNTSIAYVWMNTYPIMSDNNNAVKGRGPQTKHIEKCMANLSSTSKFMRLILHGFCTIFVDQTTNVCPVSFFVPKHKL